jgi:Mrp family chromosome partitioning ATPase
VAGYLFLLPATYQGTAVVVLRPVVTDPFTLPSSGADRAINMTAETGVATGNDVVDATSRALSRDPDDVRDALSVEVPTGGSVLRFDYSDDSEERAVAGANTAAQTYLRVREAIYQKQREALLLSYDSTLRQVTDQRKAAQKGIPEDGEVGREGTSPRTQAMLDQVAALNDQIAQLANQKAKIASADLSPGAITAAARAPLPSSHDAWLLFLLGGLLGGLLAGTLVAHGREAMDRRVRSLDQAADLIGVPALGAVRAAGRHLEEAAAADARYVSLALLQWIERNPGKPVVMLSGRDDEGRSAVSVNVAVAIAESGQDVWLVAAPDLHDAIRSVLFAAQKRTPPRARVLRPGEVQRHNGSAAPGVTVLPAVPGPPIAEDPETTLVIEHTAGQAVLAPPKPYVPPMGEGGARRPLVVAIGGGVVRLVSLGEQPMAGVAVIDAPPSDVDERGVRAAQYGVAVLVVARDRTRYQDLTRLVDRLRSAGAQTAGFVLTGGTGA